MPISRCRTVDLMCVCKNSIGSSTVTILVSYRSLIYLIIAARVVDLPLPVGPVTKTKPLGKLQRRFTSAGKPNLSSSGTLKGMARNTAAKVPR